MSEFKINTITNRDGSHNDRYVVSLPLKFWSTITKWFQQNFVVVEEEEYYIGGECFLQTNQTLDKIEIATTGNAVEFGDLTEF